ncbi:MAG: hypothetical protein ACC657_18420, partial [Thiohalomonadales bacterium]
LSTISRRYFASDLSAAIPDGTYKLVLNATSGKNVTPVLTAIPSEVEFEFDTQIPTVSFQTPDFKVYTGEATITLQLSDPTKNNYSSGIKSKSLSHDALTGGEIPAVINGIQSLIIFTEEGWHKLTLNATDYAGNKAKTKFLNVGFDSKQPVVMVVKSSIENKWWNNVDIITNVRDDETGIKEIVTGFDHIDPQTLDQAAIGSTIDLKNKPQPPELYNSHKDTEVITAKKMSKLGLLDGVHSYMARVSDFAAPAPGHTQHDIMTSIGFDITSPTITFGNTSTIFTPITTDAKVTINKQLKTIDISNWPVDAVVEELGYQAPTTASGVIVSLNGTASGIASAIIDGKSTQVSPNFLRLPVSTTKTSSITTLPQYVVTSTATKQVIWTIIATCPLPVTPGNSMQVTGTQCEEVEAGTGNLTNVATVYQWTSAAPTYVNTSDTSATDAALVKKTPIAISATDKSLSIDNGSQGGTPNGNPVSKTACLNFRVSNITSDTVLVPKRTDLAIGADSLAAENTNSPTAGTNSVEPVASPFTCDEKILANTIPWDSTPLNPVINPLNAKADSTAICTLKGTPNSAISTLFPTAVMQDYTVETQLDTQGACP